MAAPARGPEQTPPSLCTQVAVLTARGLGPYRIAAVLGRHPETVNYWLLRLQTPPPAPADPGGYRRAAREYGRALIDAKVASGQWAPPRAPQPEAAP